MNHCFDFLECVAIRCVFVSPSTRFISMSSSESPQDALPITINEKTVLSEE